MKNIKASIVSISYNQEKYIEKAINSFLFQNTNFNYEIIIADDSSSDRTTSIISSYAEENRGKIIPILRTKNIGIQKNLKDALQRAKGDYIALCEGDDFWTDKTKLQQQVDFLEKNEDYSMCFHPVEVFFEDGKTEKYIYPEEKSGFDIELLTRINYIQTNSVVFRNRDFSGIREDIMPLDWYLHLFNAQFGKIGFIDKVMSSYRKHSGGVWFDSIDNEKRLWKNHGIGYTNLFVEMFKLHGLDDRCRANSLNNIKTALFRLSEADEEYCSGMFDEYVNKMTKNADEHNILVELTKSFVAERSSLIASNEKLTVEKRSLKTIIKGKEDNIATLEGDINNIVSSKRYKYANKIAALKNKIT